MAQGEDLGHQRSVVPLAGVRPAIGGARHPGLVELARAAARHGVREHGLVGGRVERQEPAFFSRGGGRLAGALERVAGQSLDLGRVGHVARPGVGRVEHVLVELRLRRGQPLHDLAEALLALGRQRDAGEAEVAQRVLDHLALLDPERGALAIRDSLVGGAQSLVLAEFGVVGGEQRQAGVVGGAQRLAVHDAVQVAHGRPGARETVVHVLDGHDQRVPAIGPRVEQGGDRGAVGVQQLAQRGLDLRGLDGAEGGQGIVGEQGLGHRARPWRQGAPF